jgi:hypothetical protein
MDFVYCGLHVKQSCQGHKIAIDQFAFIDKLLPMPAHDVKGRLLAKHITPYKGFCGGLAWAAISTRPDIAFGTAWLTSRSTQAEHSDIVFGNKVQRRLKEQSLKLTFNKLGSSAADWRIVSYHDAGWAVCPSQHSQAGGLVCFAEASALEGKPAKCNVVDWVCAKIEHVVANPFECDINSAQLVLDHAELVNAMLQFALHGCTARQYHESQTMHLPAHLRAALVGDNKEVYSSIIYASPIYNLQDDFAGPP